MTAVDTNVLIRLLTGDDRKQEAAAKGLFESDSIWISKTVLLEAAWVLRSLYGFNQSSIVAALGILLGLENVHAEDKAAVVLALRLTQQGVDVADAMHLASRPPGSSFASFDRDLIQKAKRAGIPDVVCVTSD